MRIILFPVLFILTVPSLCASHVLDPETSVREYEVLLKNSVRNKFLGKRDLHVEKAIEHGERLTSWLKFINNARTKDTAIHLTNAQNRAGSPIEKPYIYSSQIIELKNKEIQISLPEEMKSVIYNNSPFSYNIGISDDLFIEYARKIYGIYSMAARYKLLNPDRKRLKNLEFRDVRGFHYLIQNNITEKKLINISQFSKTKIEEIKDAIIKICQNDKVSRRTCETKVLEANKKNELTLLYKKYFPIAQKNWDTFFKIKKQEARNDIVWGENQTTVPFKTPQSQNIKNFIKTNIENEYHYNGWNLIIQFTNRGPSIEFQQGITPHVNKLGGNNIVMDANSSLDEFDSQWIIRHEFGHVLGLPDCYHEFYDTSIQAYVNYQIDLTDLMCSRSGNMNERIFNELRKAYNN